MRRRHAVPLALALCAAVAVPAHADRPRAFTAVDQAGDANGVNSQATSATVSGVSTPANLAGADLRRLTVAAGPRRTVEVTVELSAPLDPTVGLDLRFDTADCDYFGDVMLDNYVDTGRASYVGGCVNGVATEVPAITGNTVRWSIPVARFRLEDHAVLRKLRVYSQAGAGAAKVYGFPFVWDEIVTEGSFVLP